MKKCEFCGKDISYYDQYCDNECESSAKAFYKKRNGSGRISSALTVISLIGFGVGAFMFLFGVKWAALAVTVCIAVFGLIVIFFPYGTDYMIKKYGIKSSVSLMKKLGIAITAIGVILIFTSAMYISG